MRKNTPSVLIGPRPEAIREARAAIVEILKITEAGEGSKTAALTALKDLCQVKNTTITNCVFGGEK